MTQTLLATKFFLPPSRPNWVVRPRLLTRLNAGLRAGCKLTLISAPAGFGKTTLVTAWLDHLRAAQPGTQAAWLSLDASDNDLAVFFGYLVGALRTCLPEVGAAMLSLLEHSPLPLLNDLARQGAAAGKPQEMR